jgi:hypothetical protein
MMGSNTLTAYYSINSTLSLHYQYSISDLENMIPWERDIYVYLVEQYVKEQNELLSKSSGSSTVYP